MTRASTPLRMVREALRRSGPVAVLVGVVVLAALLAAQGSVMSAVTILALINLLLVISLYIFSGNSGVLSFGHLAFAAVGAYVAGILVMDPGMKNVLLPNMVGFLASAHAGPLVATLAGGLAAALFAAVISIPFMRPVGITASLLTFALLLVVNVVVSNLDDVTGGESGLTGIPRSTDVGAALAWVVVAMLVAWALQQSGLGLRLRAARDDQVAAHGAGIGVGNERRFAWVLSAFFAGVAGALYAQAQGAFGPEDFFLGLTFVILAMLIIGGLRSLTGAVVGALVISIVSELLRRVEAGPQLASLDLPTIRGLREVALACIMLVVLIWRPDGLTGGREISTQSIRRLAGRVLPATRISPRSGRREPG